MRALLDPQQLDRAQAGKAESCPGEIPKDAMEVQVYHRGIEDPVPRKFQRRRGQHVGANNINHDHRDQRAGRRQPAEYQMHALASISLPSPVPRVVPGIGKNRLNQEQHRFE